MRRICTLLFTICLMIPMLSVTTLTAYAAGDETVIVLEGSAQSGDEISIDVNVRENTGVYAMLLTLDYDATALMLTDVEYGTALEGMKPLASGDLSTYPYKISFLASREENDTSTGRMMTLTFRVRPDAPDGKYTVTFNYDKNKDVSYLNDGKVETKNLIIGGTRLTVSGSGVGDIETLEPGWNEPDGAVVGAIVAASAAGVAVIVTVTLLLVRRARKKKQKWIKV